jgi:AcrR family transcriptional regulator
MSTLRMTSDLRRQLILGAAKRCFARNGFAGTTTKSVAAAASISEGLLFKHFPSKAALYAEILAEECEADPDLAHLLGQEPSTATLVELVKGMVGHFLQVAQPVLVRPPYRADGRTDAAARHSLSRLRQSSRARAPALPIHPQRHRT